MQRLSGHVRQHLPILAGALLLAAVTSNFTEAPLRAFLLRWRTRLRGGRGSNDVVISDDDLGVPVVDYGEMDGIALGQQRNPVTVSQRALEHLRAYQEGDAHAKALFLNCADWLMADAVSYGDYAVLEYRFPWKIYNLTPPWRSGMAQGQALQVLVKAHQVTGNSAYLECARRLLRAFFTEVSEGGVTFKSANGWWYEEYAGDAKARISRVLNGMMFALLGIYEYYQHTGDEDAKFLFDQGVQALERELPLYDRAGLSTYDVLGNPAGSYHQVHIEQLEQLYRITPRPAFLAYHQRWGAYQPPRTPPFVIRLLRMPNKLGVAVLGLNMLVLLVAGEGLAYLGRRR